MIIPLRNGNEKTNMSNVDITYPPPPQNVLECRGVSLEDLCQLTDSLFWSEGDLGLRPSFVAH